MPKTPKRYGEPIGIRLRKSIEHDLNVYCAQKDVSKSDVIKAAVECFMRHPDCVSRKDFERSL